MTDLDEKGLDAAQTYISERMAGTGLAPLFATPIIRAYFSAIPAERGKAVALGSEDDPESLAYALRIGARGTPFNDYQGTLYMNPRYKADDFRDAEFRDHGLARAVRVILNNADAIRAALAHPVPEREAVAWQKWHDDEAGPGWDWYISKTGNMDAAIAKELSEESATLIVNALNGHTPAAGVRVKPLEWRDDDTGFGQAQTEACGLYSYAVGDAGVYWGCQLSGRWKAESIREAKAAAQADYEARILSALDRGEPK